MDADLEPVAGRHEEITRAVRRIGGQSRVEWIGGRMCHSVLGDEGELKRFDPDLGRASGVLHGAFDRVLEQAEHVHRGAPLDGIASACAHGHRPSRPGHPAGRIKLELEKRRTRMIG